MKRIIKSLLIHDAGSGRFRTFRAFQDERYTSPFMDAIRKGDLAEIRRLVRMGGNVDRRDVQGKTPLHCVASTGGKDIAELLIANGADVNLRALTVFKELHPSRAHVYWETPLDCARSAEMKALLRKHGAKTGKELDQDAAK